MKFLLGAIIYLGVCSAVNATKYWPTKTLTDWSIYLNNGVVYITSSQIPKHCSHSRMQIDTSTSEFNKSLYAYALSAKARNKSLRYVIDDSQTVCSVYGLQELS